MTKVEIAKDIHFQMVFFLVKIISEYQAFFFFLLLRYLKVILFLHKSLNSKQVLDLVEVIKLLNWIDIEPKIQ
jgi:hypothetical protein